MVGFVLLVKKDIKVSLKFCNILVIFDKVMKVANHTGLWDAELTWYYPSFTCWICLYNLEHSLGIYDFRPTWPCLIVEVITAQTKFLELSGYCNLIKWTFTFCPTNVFGCFGVIMWPCSSTVSSSFPQVSLVYLGMEMIQPGKSV